MYTSYRRWSDVVCLLTGTCLRISLTSNIEKFVNFYCKVLHFTLHQKWFFPFRISSVNVTTQFPANLVTFTVEILNGKLHFLCSVRCLRKSFDALPSSYLVSLCHFDTMPFYHDSRFCLVGIFYCRNICPQVFYKNSFSERFCKIDRKTPVLEYFLGCRPISKNTSRQFTASMEISICLLSHVLLSGFNW